jgi:hypothetical protein
MDFSKEILFWENLIPEDSYCSENVETVIKLFRSGDYCREEKTGYPLLGETIAKAANFPTHNKLEPDRTLAICRWMGFTMADWSTFRYPKLDNCHADLHVPYAERGVKIIIEELESRIGLREPVRCVCGEKHVKIGDFD